MNVTSLNIELNLTIFILLLLCDLGFIFIDKASALYHTRIKKKRTACK